MIHKIIFIFGLICLVSTTSLNAQTFTVNATAYNETTNGAGDGKIVLSLMDAFAPVAFSWNGPNGYTNTSQNINQLKPGQYCVTVSDAVCREAVLCVLVNKCDPIISLTGEIPCAGSPGHSTLTMQGPSPYTIQWGTSAVDVAFQSPYTRKLGPGAYSVTVTDAAGCSESASIFLNTTTQPMYTPATLVNPTTCNPNGGNIFLSPTGGTMPYTYEWSDGSTSKDRIGIQAGEYCVTVVDAKGCQDDNCFTLEKESKLLQINAVRNNVATCDEGGDLCQGSASVTVLNGIAPFTYKWTGPNGFLSFQQNITDLCPGLYNVKVVDALGCSVTQAVNICCCNKYEDLNPQNPGSLDPALFCNEYDTPSILKVNVTSVAQIQAGNTTGSININPSGGSGQYTYSWTGPNGFTASTKNISNLAEGTYTLMLSDGCKTVTRTIEIVDCNKNKITFTTSIEPACPGYNSGQIKLNIGGGTPAYNIKWSNGSQAQLISDLVSGQHCVTVTDVNYCRKEECFEVPLNQLQIVNFQCTQLTYCGSQVVKTQQFSPVWVYDSPLGCRFARAVCVETGYSSDYQDMGIDIVRPADCWIQFVCKNGQILNQLSGQRKLYSFTSKIEPGKCNGKGYCTDYSACFYDIDGQMYVDETTIQPVSVYDAEFVAVPGSYSCEGCYNPPYTCWVKEWFCHNQFIGYTLHPYAEPPMKPIENTNLPFYPAKDILEDFKRQLKNDNIKVLSELKLDSLHGTNTVLNTEMSKKVKIFPNPFNQSFFIKLIGGDWKFPLEFVLTDARGVEIQRFGFEEKNINDKYEFIVNDILSSGVYFLKAPQSNGQIVVEKLLKI